MGFISRLLCPDWLRCCPVANTKWIIHCGRHVMSSSNHYETLRWTWSSASVLSLFPRHCISAFHCSLTNIRVQPTLIKSTICWPWPLCGSLSTRPGNKWDIWKGWVHVERWGSGAALWAPSFSFASSDLINLNLKKKWCHHDRDAWRCSGFDIIMTLTPQGKGDRGRSRGVTLRPEDVWCGSLGSHQCSLGES